MKRLLSALFPYLYYLSLVCTWLMITGLYVLVVLFLFGHFPLWIIGLFAPINFEVAFSAYGGFLMLLYQPTLTPGEAFFAYFFCVIPLLTLILILGGDWAM